MVLSLVILVLTSVIAGLAWKHWELVQATKHGPAMARSNSSPSSSLVPKLHLQPGGNFSSSGQTTSIKSSIVEYLLFIVGATAIGVAIARDMAKRP